MSKLTVDEIVDTVKHSKLPTVFIEGPDDMVVLRRVEELLGCLNASFIPCGDRETLMKVFNRRGEFSHIKNCFIADKDMWLFSGIPAGLEEIIFTEGYSIENDLYSDSNIEQILYANERAQHNALIGEVCRWFCFEVHNYLQGKNFRSDPPLARLIPLPGIACCNVYLAEIGYYDAPVALRETITRNYAFTLRGKLLFEIIVRFTHAPNRNGARHSYKSLIEVAITYGIRGKLMSRILDAIKTKLGIIPKAQLSLTV